MFQDICNGTVSIESSWKKEKYKASNATQTSEVLTYEASVQSTDTTESSVQTDPIQRLKLPNKLVIDNSEELRKFLNRVEPMVSAALRSNVRSHAFDGYKVQWDEEHSTVTNTHTLRYPPCSSEFSCTNISWNSTGSVIAVSYGKFNHDDWCTHTAALCTWNLDRRTLDAERPDNVIEIATCVMCCQFHPNLPSIIAAGLFTGEIKVFNTSIEGDAMVAQTGYTEIGHKEPIVQLSWLLDADDRSQTNYLILSLGSDGKMLLWKWAGSQGGPSSSVHAVTELQIVNGFSLQSMSIPQNIRVAKGNVTSLLGGTCFSVSSEDSSVIVVGCENGSLVKCSIDTSTASTTQDIQLNESDLRSPVRYAFTPHHGPVYGVSCSPYHRNLFLSCGVDTVTRLYSLLESSPLILIEPGKGYLYSVTWSVSRPLVVLLGTADGSLLIYDLKTSKINPRVSIPVCEGKPVYCIQYNRNRHKVVATGDGRGVVKVFRLSTELSQTQTGEYEALDQLTSDNNNYL